MAHTIRKRPWHLGTLSIVQIGKGNDRDTLSNRTGNDRDTLSLEEIRCHAPKSKQELSRSRTRTFRCAGNATEWQPFATNTKSTSESSETPGESSLSSESNRGFLQRLFSLLPSSSSSSSSSSRWFTEKRRRPRWIVFAMSV